MFSRLFPKSYKKKNLLLLGASGGVSNALLHYLVHHRNLFEHIILLDKSDKVLTDPYIDHRRLQYHFIHRELKLPEHEKEYLEILKVYKIDIVIDVTDIDSIPILEATNKAGVSYINTGMNGEVELVSDLVLNIWKRRDEFNKARHIICAGMNPGVVNMWVRYGIEKFGVPKEVVHFEYDTSTIALGWKAMMTWCLKEFIVESTRDPGGLMLGRDNVKHVYPNALKNRVDMTSILSPIMHLEKYPHGFQVLHEENLTIAQKYNIPSQFIYAFNMDTMDTLVAMYDEEKMVYKKDLLLGDNLQHPLEGSDNIGVLLKYDNKKVYYFNTAPNISAIGTNGTYTQVIIGIFSALFVLLFDRDLKKGLYFVEDLFDSYYKYYLFDNMRVQEYVFEKQEDRYKLESYTPHVKIRRKSYLEHYYI